jgi:hypothetical protein
LAGFLAEKYFKRRRKRGKIIKKKRKRKFNGKRSLNGEYSQKGKKLRQEGRVNVLL